MALLCYTDILNPNADFQRAVNLSLDQGNLMLVEKYIPTVASATLIARYLKAVLHPGNDRASILIGPYGKGKSHTLFVIFSVLSETGKEADAVFSRLADRVEIVHPQAANLIRKVRQAGVRLLPVIVNDRYLDIRQAFLASVKTALTEAGLTDIMPDNYCERCLATINRWKADYPATYTAYKQYLKAIGRKVADFESSLRQFDAAALSIFRDCHQTILSGAPFDPLLESDVPTLYRNISEALCAHTVYSGLFIVFDEFGKYLESTSSNGERFKTLQDLAELCSRSNEPRMLLACVSHKAISEYASQLNQIQRGSFRTIEGRFEPIYFTSTFEGSFSLIAGALRRNAARYQQFMAKHSAERAATIHECNALGCFAGYESSVEQIVDLCFPMHPLTTLTLMKLSEQAAQNERTLFTFLSEEDSPFAAFIRANRGEYALASASMVYDYFHVSIRENSYDKELRDIIIHVDSLIPTLSIDEGKLVKVIVLFSMIADSSLLATKAMLMAALQWDEERLQQSVAQLEQNHHIYVRRSDGVICMMRNAAETVRQDIEREVLRRSHIDLAVQLSELRDPGYAIPRRYNDKYEMVRFFQNVFLTPERLIKQPNATFLTAYGQADGYVIYLLGQMPPDAVRDVLKRWNDPRVVVLLPAADFAGQSAVAECAAIRHMLEHPADEVAAEELSYYYEDLLQMVNQAYAAIFTKNMQFVTQQSVECCTNLSAMLSTLCETVLYPDCPVICHEMMNRTIISSQMKQARAKVIDTIFHTNDFLQVFPTKTVEAPIMQAVLGHLQSEKMRHVIDIITDYLATCEKSSQPLSRLYEQLTQPPYGMRRGVLPILLAYCLREQYQNTVLYNHGQEISLSGESMNALDEHSDDYELLVDPGSAEQSKYLQILHDCYTPDAPLPEPRGIHSAICKLVRSLPRSARANKTILIDGKVVKLLQSVLDVRSLFVRYDSNAREVLLEQLPKCCGYLSSCVDCALDVKSDLEELCHYTKRLSMGMAQILRTRMGAATEQSLRGAMTVWLQKQSSFRLNHSFSSTTAALLEVLRNEAQHTDTEWMNMLAVALTGLPIEDWSDRQVEAYPKLLDTALTEVEQVDEAYGITDDSAALHLTLGGRTLEQALPDQELEGLSSVAYESVRSTLQEFGDSLSTNEKLLVLANLMLHINE